MSETLLAVVGAVVFIGGPFLLLWLMDRRRQAKGQQAEMPAGRRLLRLLGILVAGVVVIVGVFLACTWVMVAQPTVGPISLSTVVVVVVIVGLSIGFITHYVGLLAEIVSFISGPTRKPSAVMDPDRLGSAEAAQEPTVTEELRPADIEELLVELEEAEAEKGPGEGES